MKTYYLFIIVFLNTYAFAQANPPLSSLNSYCNHSDSIIVSANNKINDIYNLETLHIGNNLFNNDINIFKVPKLKQTYLFIFKNLVLMNTTLARASVFAMNLEKPLNHEEHLNLNVLNEGGIIGHDLEESLIRNFISQLEKIEYEMSIPYFNYLKIQSLCAERLVWQNHIWPIISKKGTQVIIAVSLEYAYKTTLSHELLHAVFYHNRSLQEDINQFWEDNVSEVDMSLIIDILENLDYKVTNNKKLLLNEFFAYLLQIESDNDVLEKFVSKYKFDFKNYILEKHSNLSTFIN